MVVFGLFLTRKNELPNSTHPCNNTDILGELMDMRDRTNDVDNNGNTGTNDTRVHDRSYSTSSDDLTKIQLAMNVDFTETENIRTELFKATILQLQEEVNTLKDDIKFLKDEFKQKNDLINFFVTRNASEFPQEDIIKESTMIANDTCEKTPSLRESHSIFGSPRKNVNDQLKEVREQKHQDFVDKNANNSLSEPIPSTEFAAWEKHNNGFATRIMKKMGYGGKGLGKHEDGITEPINIDGNKLEMKSRCSANRVIPERGLTKEMTSSTMSLNSKRRLTKNSVHHWAKGTTLIAGDSILNGVEERRLHKNVKVRAFPGARVDDLYDYLAPLVKKRPTNIILHIGSNDAIEKNSDQILKEILDLKANILSILPTVRVYLSCPTLRLDNRVVNDVLRDLDLKLKSLTCDIISNDNVDRTCLGKKGLHLNPKGSGRLAMNYIALMRRL